jgi:hypothetical protein
LLFELWISVPQISSFRPAAPLYYLNSEFRFHDHFFRDYNISQAISAIIMTNYGHQFPDSLSFRASSASASIRVEIFAPQNPFSHLYLFLFTRILVAIYRFRCRMSNTKISTQLATLDGPVIVSSVLCRENYPYLRHEALHRWMH